MAVQKSPLSGRGVPKPANQGGHGSAPTQPVRTNSVPTGVQKPGPSTILFTKQPGGTKGSGKSF